MHVPQDSFEILNLAMDGLVKRGGRERLVEQRIAPFLVVL